MSGRLAGGWGPRLSPTGTWSPRGQRCDRPRILVTCTLVSFSHGLHTGFGHGCPALRSVCPLPPVLHRRHPPERSLQCHRLQVPPRPPAYRSDQGAQACRLSATQWDCPSSWRQDMQRSTKTRQPARAGTGCHMVGPWPRSVIQPHSAIFRVRRTAHCSEAEHPRLALGHTAWTLPSAFPVTSQSRAQPSSKDALAPRATSDVRGRRRALASAVPRACWPLLLLTGFLQTERSASLTSRPVLSRLTQNSHGVGGLRVTDASQVK